MKLLFEVSGYLLGLLWLRAASPALAAVMLAVGVGLLLWRGLRWMGRGLRSELKPARPVARPVQAVPTIERAILLALFTRGKLPLSELFVEVSRMRPNTVTRSDQVRDVFWQLYSRGLVTLDEYAYGKLTAGGERNVRSSLRR